MRLQRPTHASRRMVDGRWLMVDGDRMDRPSSTINHQPSTIRQAQSPLPFALAFLIGALTALFGIAAGRISLAAGVLLTSLLSILYLARPETALQLVAIYWPFHEILYLFAEGERIVLWADLTLVVFTLLWISRSFIRKERLLPRPGTRGAVRFCLGG